MKAYVRLCLAASVLALMTLVVMTLIPPARAVFAQDEPLVEDAELAFKKMQYRQRPDEPGLLEEVGRLREKVKALVG